MTHDVLTLIEAAERLRVLEFWANNICRDLPAEPPIHVPRRKPRKSDPSKGCLHQANRQRRVKQATPPWFDRDAVERLYLHAHRLSQRRKEKHHVDHVIPLWHPLVCGLHTHQNMRVISQSQNVKKSNRFSLRWFKP